MAGRPKGYAKTGGGSRKGRPNKATADLKSMIIEALHNAGGEHYLREQAIQNPVAFLGLLGKILQMQVNGSGNVFGAPILRLRRSAGLTP